MCITRVDTKPDHYFSFTELMLTLRPADDVDSNDVDSDDNDDDDVHNQRCIPNNSDLCIHIMAE